MKKIYLLFALLLAFVGVTKMQGREVTIEVNKNNGEWTLANAAKTWGAQWASYSEDPKLTITQQSKANNMDYYDGMNIEFFDRVGLNGATGTGYEIAAEGWYIKSVSFEFRSASKGSGSASAVTDGTISVSLNGEEPAYNDSRTDFVPYELTDIEETSSVVLNVFTDGSTNNFAQTRNFVVVLESMPESEAALKEMMKVVETYEGYHFNAGSEPGNYGEAEVAAFLEAIDNAYSADNNPDYGDMSDEELTNTYKALAEAIKQAYEAVLASRNTTMVLADGYYRIKTGLQYYTTETITDEETGEEYQETVYHDKYMRSILDGETIKGRWGSSDDVDTDCSILWKVTNKNGYFDIVNMATDSRFDAIVNRSAPLTMSLSSQNLIQLDPFITYEGTTYVNIRRAPVDGEKYQYENYWYLHQSGHSSGKGKEGNLVLWNSSGSFNPNNDNPVSAGGSEWIFIPVDETLAEQIISAYEPEKDLALLKERYKMVLADAKEKMEIAKDIQSEISDEALISSVDQLSSPSTESSEGSLEELLDGDTTTFWHSAWSGGSVANGTHYLQVELTASDVTAVAMTFTRRPATNDHITEWGIFGTNDPEAEKDACEALAELSTPYGNNTETLTSAAFETKGYKYLRFYIDGTTTGRGYGHMSEFQLYKATIIQSETCQYNVLGDVAKNLSNVLDAQKDLDINNLTKEEYETLKAAYDAFIEKFVDPTELRQTLESVKDAGEGVVIGTNPGYWTDKSASNTLATTIATATAYDEAGAYTQEQSDKYVADLKAQADAIITSAINVKEGKWYRIRFATEEFFEAHGWDKIAGYNEDNADEPLWNKYVTVANYVQGEEDGEYEIEPLDAEDATIGENLFFDDDADITDKDMSMFRFINVGDSAFMIQNKATGLFLKATSGTSTVTLNAHPSLFKVKALGYGFNLLATENINGTSQNYLHGQKLYNVLVTWNAYTAGSASGMFIEEAGDVASDYEGTDFNVSVLIGEIATFCYPVGITATEEGMFDVKVDGTTITLVPITEAAAGRPFVYVHGAELESYNEDGEREFTIFKHDYTLVTEPQTENALKGTFVSTILDRGEVYAEGNTFKVNRVSKTAPMDYCEVGANRAYISTEEGYPYNAELTITIDLEGEDGIAETLTKVAKSGAIYTIDGRLVSKKGNVSDLSRYGKGIYILNGVKVVVK